jgi:hypothetical protein
MHLDSPSSSHSSKPWHRQLWPWLVMAPPMAAVLAGAVMFWLAVASDDGLVTPDYYRQGIEINRRLTASEAADCAVKDRACMNAPSEQRR